MIATSAATGRGPRRAAQPRSSAPCPRRPTSTSADDGEVEADPPGLSPGRGRGASPCDAHRRRARFRVEGERVERLIARHDLGNDEALRYLEDRLRSMGVIRALECRGLRAGRRRGDRRHRVRAGPAAPLGASRGRAAAPLTSLPSRARPLAALAAVLALLAGSRGRNSSDEETWSRWCATSPRPPASRTAIGSAGSSSPASSSSRRPARRATRRRTSARSRSTRSGADIEIVKITKRTVDGDTATVTAELAAAGPQGPADVQPGARGRRL